MVVISNENWNRNLISNHYKAILKLGGWYEIEIPIRTREQ